MYRFIVLIILGVLVVAMPYVSFPPAFESMALVAIGMLVIVLSGYCLVMFRRHSQRFFNGKNPDHINTPDIDTVDEMMHELSDRVGDAFGNTSRAKERFPQTSSRGMRGVMSDVIVE